MYKKVQNRELLFPDNMDIESQCEAFEHYTALKAQQECEAAEASTEIRAERVGYLGNMVYSRARYRFARFWST